MYGWQMTFEDPPYENDDDLVDINNSPSAGRGVVKNLAPNGGQLNFEFPVPAVGPPDKQRTLEALMRAYGSQRPLNQFTVRHVGNVSHIVPVLLRRRDGQIAAAESILDQKISFPRAERNSWETFQLVLSSLSEATRTKINMGVVGMSVLRQATSTEGPQDEPARAVLTRIFEDVNRLSITRSGEPRHLVWHLLFEPNSGSYFFNMHAIQVEADTPEGKRRRPV
jgi:hypothetical protein